MKNKKGFTLVELLAVIVVLALLALLAGNAVGNMISKSQWNTFKTDALTVAKAAETAYEVGKLEGTAKTTYSCKDLIDLGYLELDNTNYEELKTANSSKCKVDISDTETKVTLKNTSNKYYVSGAKKDLIAQDEFGKDSTNQIQKATN